MQIFILEAEDVAVFDAGLHPTSVNDQSILIFPVTVTQIDLR